MVEGPLKPISKAGAILLSEKSAEQKADKLEENKIRLQLWLKAEVPLLGSNSPLLGNFL